MPIPILYNKKFNELTEDEKELLKINKKSISDFVEQSSIISDVNYATRNAHAKTYAVLKGEFIINRDLPDQLQPFFDKERYELVIRLSNAHLKIKQSKKDIPAYGFSVKIKDDNGEVLANYPLVNFPLFPVNSVSTFLKLFTSINHFFIKKWNNLFPLLIQIVKATPSLFTFSFLKNIVRLIGQRNHFFLSFDYHSIGAYRLGEYVMKIQLSPKSVEKNFGRKMNTREAIESYFTTNDYTADVFIQLCYDLKDQPINKLNREWKNSPLIKVGEVKIEKNSILERTCENELLSFNPFESKTIFQPVGKIQKLRDETYKVSVQTRRKINKLLHG
ncbi:catalase [Chryseobacterium sp. ISL-6]|uniref:catalase n=1 Tax=Chryseobacterium sp. ISL-6 TaxID=2819143 RepID=UPI001BEC2C72|nr:catalase [Chryseobacterium sp. ISL-6]MBT2621010.1 catalase [Chryseobacterium sp. ISL-6]